MDGKRSLLTLTCCGVLVLCAGTGGWAFADDPPKAGAPKAPDAKGGAPAMDPDMMAWVKAGTPGDMHKWMDSLSGKWDCVVKSWMAPDAPPDESKGTMTNEMILGGRYMRSTFKGDMMGQPFDGLAMTAFNNTTGKFEGTWADSMSTGMMWMTGTYDTATKTMTMTGEMADPVTGKMKKSREVTRYPDANKHISQFFDVGPDGKETMVMEITYTRAAGAAKPADKAMDKADKAAKDMEKKMNDAAKNLPGGNK